MDGTVTLCKCNGSKKTREVSQECQGLPKMHIYYEEQVVADYSLRAISSRLVVDFFHRLFNEISVYLTCNTMRQILILHNIWNLSISLLSKFFLKRYNSASSWEEKVIIKGSCLSCTLDTFSFPSCFFISAKY